MSKVRETWHSPRVGREISVVRYGEIGTPVLFFPTAAGDAEEAERFLLVDALGDLMGEGLVKFYSVDSVAGMAWLTEDHTTAESSRLQRMFLETIAHEVVPAIRKDCGDDELEVVAAGPSIGAFNSLAALCLYPDLFRAAVCMSGTYDLRKFLQGEPTRDYYDSSPLHFVPQLPEGEHLAKLRERFALITHATGRWEEPEQSWRVADAIGKKGVPNRVDEWGDEWDHDWPLWRQALPQYLRELLAGSAGG